MKKDPNEPKCTYKYTDGTPCNRPLTRGYKDKEGEQYCIFHARNDEKLPQLKQEILRDIKNRHNSFYQEINVHNFSEDNENHKDKIAELRSKYALNYEGAYVPDGFNLFNNFVLEVDISFDNAIFNGSVHYNNAIFSGGANFRVATFRGGTYFNSVTFNGNASFYRATFSGEANFSVATFSDVAYFHGATFSGNAVFHRATFSDVAYFQEATFSGEAEFNDATFSDKADFRGATFSGNAIFREATFCNVAYFRGVTFCGMANFYGAAFSGEAEFYRVTFSGKASFYEATFSGEANFSVATFSDEAYFERATFSGEVEFIDVLFIADVTFDLCRLDEGKLKFLDTAFFSTGSFHDISEGSNITFINCCLPSVSFLRSRIADTVFANCCFNLAEGWINKKIQEINKPKFLHESDLEKLNQRLILLNQEKDKMDDLKGRNKKLLEKNLLSEHRDFLKHPHFRILIRKLSKRGLKITSAPLLFLFSRKFKSIRKKISSLDEAPSLINFGEIRDNYMQLKVNMDRMKDYDLANDFYFGEMEMKRFGEKWYKPKRWFLSLYKTLSGYGNNPGRAIGVFFLLMAFFSLPLFFDWIKIRKDINYGSIITQSEIKIENDSFYSVLMNPLFILSPDLKKNYKKNTPQNVSNKDDVIQRNCWDLLSIFFFNITAISNIYKPTYIASNEWASYYLGFVHYFIRPVQIALIILAIRRKVKRGEE